MSPQKATNSTYFLGSTNSFLLRILLFKTAITCRSDLSFFCIAMPSLSFRKNVASKGDKFIFLFWLPTSILQIFVHWFSLAHVQFKSTFRFLIQQKLTGSDNHVIAAKHVLKNERREGNSQLSLKQFYIQLGRGDGPTE